MSKNIKIRLRERVSNNSYKQYLSKLEKFFNNFKVVENVITIKDYKLYERCLEKNLNRQNKSVLNY